MTFNYTLERVHATLESCNVDWRIAGGWAIDYFLGEITREHDDVDVSVLRTQETAFREYPDGWDVWPGIGNGGTLERSLSPNDQLPSNAEVL